MDYFDVNAVIAEYDSKIHKGYDVKLCTKLSQQTGLGLIEFLILLCIMLDVVLLALCFFRFDITFLRVVLFLIAALLIIIFIMERKGGNNKGSKIESSVKKKKWEMSNEIMRHYGFITDDAVMLLIDSVSHQLAIAKTACDEEQKIVRTALLSVFGSAMISFFIKVMNSNEDLCAQLAIVTAICAIVFALFVLINTLMVLFGRSHHREVVCNELLSFLFALRIQLQKSSIK